MLNWQSPTNATSPTAPDPFKAIDAVGVASLFYKLAGSTPDFEKWARTSERYHKAPDYDKDIILDEIVMRLREQYYNTFVDEYLHIGSTVSLKNYSAHQEALFFDEIDENTYFSYSAFGEDFAIIVKNIDRFNKIDMPADLYALFDNAQNARVEFTLRALHAETEEPLLLGQKYYWVVVCDIAQFRIWDAEKANSLFVENAPWYKDESSIKDLYIMKKK